MATPIVLYTFGYWGWGSATTELLEIVTAVEASRGFEPPAWADIRIKRNVRAKGFSGDAFQKLVGERYKWWKELGNELASDPEGRIEISDPSAAAEMLTQSVAAAADRSRTLFFCSCEYPYPEGRAKASCHRVEVGRLLLTEASNRGVSLEIVEWPGGTPSNSPFDLHLSASVFKAVWQGGKTISISEPLQQGQLSLATVGALPWGSIARLHCDGRVMYRVIGPARFRNHAWGLPVMSPCTQANDDQNLLAEQAALVREDFGFTPQQ